MMKATVAVGFFAECSCGSPCGCINGMEPIETGRCTMEKAEALARELAVAYGVAWCMTETGARRIISRVEIEATRSERNERVAQGRSDAASKEVRS